MQCASAAAGAFRWRLRRDPVVRPVQFAKTRIPPIDQTNPDNWKGHSVIGLRMICVYVKLRYLEI
ncbi:hypothetical protein BDI4_40006 [Burkholderia diffusa]|nr:hypothetical protein BDI4_40006 [Burkholderia diffusa]